MVKIRNQFLPYCLPSFGEEESNEVLDTLRGGWLTLGPKTKKFEKNFAEYIGARYAIGLSSCTAALHLGLLAHQIGPGDEVLLPSFTFAATANMVVNVGAKPVFVDIEKDSLNIDPRQIRKKMTPKTKAILPVHYGGNPVALEEIMEIAKGNGLVVLEDAAHAVGSEYKNKKIGSFGNTTCFSFYVTKNMATGEGGMLTTNDSDVAEFVLKNRLHGISHDAWKRYSGDGTWEYKVDYAGWKYNMNDLQASLGLHQLNKLDRFIAIRNQYARIYQEGLRDIRPIQIPVYPPCSKNSFHLFPVLIQDFDRNELIRQLSARKIGVSVHFIPLHLHPFYQMNFGYKEGDLPITEEVFKRVISLPLYPKMSEDDLQYVITCIREILCQ